MEFNIRFNEMKRFENSSRCGGSTKARTIYSKRIKRFICTLCAVAGIDKWWKRFS